MKRRRARQSEKSITKFKISLVKTFDELYDFGLYTVKQNLFYQTGKEIRRFRALFILKSTPYDHLNVHIQKVYGKIRRGEKHE